MTDQTHVDPVVSERELDLTILEGEDRFLKVQVLYYEVSDHPGRAKEDVGAFVARSVARFPIRSQLPVPVMASFLRLETRINNALASEEIESADEELEATLSEAHRRIVSLIIERTPRAFAELEMDHDGRKVRVKPTIELDVSQMLVTLSWIAGDTSVADAVARTLTAGQSRSKTAEELEAADADDAEAAERSGEATARTPFPSSAP